MTTSYYLRVEDYVQACIGPFASVEAAQAHFDWCKTTRNDSAVLISIDQEPPRADDDLVVTEEEDRLFLDPAAQIAAIPVGEATESSYGEFLDSL